MKFGLIFATSLIANKEEGMLIGSNSIWEDELSGILHIRDFSSSYIFESEAILDPSKSISIKGISPYSPSSIP